MKAASLLIDPSSRIAELDHRIFGSFVEHMGRAVYTGVFEPDHPTADERGFRADVLDLVRELGVSVIRYPGGNFVSGYRWEDGVGPVGDRPRRLDLAWRSIETNAFGLNEFMAWSKAANVEPMLAVNLGTRGVQEACDLLEYCNFPEGTYWSDLRRKHGVEAPHNVRLWCLGNEMDASWQVGQKTAEEYGRLAAETAKAMKIIDPSIELIACGSSNSGMPTFAAWEATVLEHTYDYVDYIALHTYYDPRRGPGPGADHDEDFGEFLASGADLDAFITAVAATSDHVGARLRRRKRIKLSCDEWNVWYQSRFVQPSSGPWQVAPRLIEDEFTVADAVVVGSLLTTLMRHADRIGLACQAQLTNVIAPIRTEPGGPAWRQTIYYPFAQASRLACGTVLQVQQQSPTYETPRYGPVPHLDSAATHDEENGEVALFLVNRGREPLDLTVNLRAFPRLALADHQVLADDDLSATNTAENPDRVRPRRLTDGTVEENPNQFRTRLPPVSWSVLAFQPAARVSDGHR